MPSPQGRFPPVFLGPGNELPRTGLKFSLHLLGLVLLHLVNGRGGSDTEAPKLAQVVIRPLDRVVIVCLDKLTVDRFRVDAKRLGEIELLQGVLFSVCPVPFHLDGLRLLGVDVHRTSNLLGLLLVCPCKRCCRGKLSGPVTVLCHRYRRLQNHTRRLAKSEEGGPKGSTRGVSVTGIREKNRGERGVLDGHSLCCAAKGGNKIGRKGAVK
mmetsp:Transcript_16845/g.40444  ORF Transcript_16845/g.40444 Transcript_16845/m.40444 type:complete len:211 (-) Transcript_16845:1994-2626(-)